MKPRHNHLKAVGALVLAAALMLSSSISVFAQVPCTGETWGTNAATAEEAQSLAMEVLEQICAEGQVLLKNDGTLPLGTENWISLLPTSSQNASQTIVDGIESAGFKVFATSTNDPAKYTDLDKRQHKKTDVAIVVMTSVSEASQDAWSSGPGGGGEGKSSASLTEVEDNMDADGNPYLFEDGTPFLHKFLPYKLVDGEPEYYKTSLQISDKTEEVIKYATDNFDKVIVVLFNSNPSEVGILQLNDKINAILLSGPITGTSTGIDQLGKILSGETNPSGRTVDLWAYDITGRPSWFNDGNANNIFPTAEDEEAYEFTNIAITSAFRDGEADENGLYPYHRRQQHSLTGSDITPYVYTVQYEEDIYTGYRYYETAATEAALGNYDGFVYEHEVLYPFGYGLSYTNFFWEIVDTDLTDWGKQQDEYENGGKLVVKVKVTNIGNVAGKDVVELFAHAPYYENGVSKAEHVLVGFEKTSLLKPGQSEVLTISMNIQDMASFDYLDANGNGTTTYELDKNGAADTAGNPVHDSVGKYELRVMKNSHDYGNDDKEAMTIALDDLAEDIILDKDDFSGSTVEALFSGDDINNTLGWDPETNQTLVEEGKMTLLSRADFAGTWPAVATAEQLIRSEKYFDTLTQFADYNAENWETYHTLVYGEEATAGIESEDDSLFPWAVSEAEFKGEEEYQLGINLAEKYDTASWTQRSESSDLAALQASDDWLWFPDMVGVDYRNGGEELALWNKFMNELTYQEMIEWITNGGRRTGKIDTVGKQACSYVDASSRMNTSHNLSYADQYISCRTWNKALSYKRGVVVGETALLDGIEAYYAPAVDLHRSPFAGRNDEYWSEDGFLAGYMAGNMLAGCQSTGLICTVKHFALNENENMRQSLHTYVSEQAFRELYLPAFHICMQEFGSWGVMTAYNCIGDTHATSAYAFNTLLLGNEWGFDGFNISDAADAWKDFYTDDMALRVGLNQFLCDWSASNGFDQYHNKANVRFYPTGKYNEEENLVYISPEAEDQYDVVSYTSWVALRVAVMKALFVEVNSNIGNNGINFAKYTGGDLPDAMQGADYTASVAYEGKDATYTLESGALPAGISISGGKISGKPTAAGDYEFVIRLTSGNYITTTATYKLHVEEAFATDEPTDALQVGEEFSAYIEPDESIVDKYDKWTYAVASGSALPAGLELNAEDGEIFGTPAQAGRFTTTFTVTGQTVTMVERSGRMQEQTTNINFTYDVKFVIADEDGNVPEEAPAGPGSGEQAPAGDEPAGQDNPGSGNPGGFGGFGGFGGPGSGE